VDIPERLERFWWSLQVKGQGDQKIGKKFTQVLEKVAQTVAKPKIAKISTSKLNLKIQNIFLKNENTCKMLLYYCFI